MLDTEEHLSHATEAAIPTEFVFFEEEASARGQALTRKLADLAGTDVTLPSSVARAMGESLDHGDRLGDAWYTDAVARGSVRTAREEFYAAMSDGIDAVPNASSHLRALFAQITTEPDWLDWDLLDYGAEVFRRYGKELYPYYGMTTFLGYRTPSVTKPLILTGAYTGNSALHRFWETCKFWTDIGEIDGLRRGHDGFVTALRVRLLHCMIRQRILNHPEWDRPRLGVPISQFNMFSTLMAGSFIGGQDLKRLGYRTSDADLVAVLHFWRYVGYIMGVDTPFYPETVDDGFRAMRLLALAQRTKDDQDSRTLCHSFMDVYRPPADASGLARIKAELSYKFNLGHAAFYAPGSYAKAGFPPVGLWRHAPLLRFVPNYLRETARRHVPGVAQLIDRRHRAFRQADLKKTVGAAREGYNAVAQLTR